MTQSLQLPPGYILRPARVVDTWAMLMLELGLPSKAISSTSSDRQVQQEILLQPISILIIAMLLFDFGVSIFFLWLFLSFSLEFDRSSFLFHTILSLIILSIIGFRFIWKQWLQLGWVVQNREHIVGYAILRQYPRYTVLKRIFIDPKHRRRKIGCYLLEATIRQSRKPIYCWSTYSSVRFFQRLGFVSVPLRQLPLREIIGTILSAISFTKSLIYR